MLKKSYLLFLANLGERIKEDTCIGIIHPLSVNLSHSDFFSETVAEILTKLDRKQVQKVFSPVDHAVIG